MAFPGCRRWGGRLAHDQQCSHPHDGDGDQQADERARDIEDREMRFQTLSRPAADAEQRNTGDVVELQLAGQQAEEVRHHVEAHEVLFAEGDQLDELLARRSWPVRIELVDALFHGWPAQACRTLRR